MLLIFVVVVFVVFNKNNNNLIIRSANELDLEGHRKLHKEYNNDLMCQNPLLASNSCHRPKLRLVDE